MGPNKGTIVYLQEMRLTIMRSRMTELIIIKHKKHKQGSKTEDSALPLTRLDRENKYE